MSLAEGDVLLLTAVIEVCNPQNIHHTHSRGRLICHQSIHGKFHVLTKKIT